jgi:hypothetical protein
MGAQKGKIPALPEGLRLALSDTGARKRILEVNQRDKRTLSAIDQRFRDLDRLVDFLLKHLDDPVPVDVPASPMRKRQKTDMDLALSPEDAAPSGGFTEPKDGDTLVDVDAIHAVPSPPSAIPEPPLPAMEPELPPPGLTAVVPGPRTWQKPPKFREVSTVQALLNDVMWLLEIKDGEGMLISLERLLVSHRLEGELAAFADENETKLMNVYESYLGPFTRTVKSSTLAADKVMPDAFLTSAKVACISELVREGLSLDSLLKTSPYSVLETCCVVSQLRRVGLATVS